MKQVLLSSVGELTTLVSGSWNFSTGKRLTGEATLANEEVFGSEDSHVARNHVARRELDDVPGHQVAQRHFLRLAIPNDGGGHMDHGLELRRRRVCPGLLQEAQRDAEHHHGRHYGSGARVAGSEGNGRQSRQQNHQRITNDLQQTERPALAAFLRHLIRTCGAQPLFGLGLGQPSG